jgi:hypothetical protein
MDGDSDQSANRKKPPMKAIRRCAICGSTAHTAGHHDSVLPGSDGAAPIEFATEEVVIEDDDRR